MSKDCLFKEFDAVSAKAWKQKIQADLKGADYNDTLVWDSPDGIKVKPIYHADDFEKSPPLKVAPPSRWAIGQSIYAGNAKAANKKALKVLDRGAESLLITVPSDQIEIETLLKDIDLSRTTLYFQFQFLSATYIEGLKKFVEGKKANIHLNIDLLGNLARTGNWYHSLQKDHALLDRIMEQPDSQAGISVIGVDMSLFQNAGANRIQQLAYSLAQANEYLGHLGDHASKVQQGFTFKVSVDGDYFFEIAKLRALRHLWKVLASEYGLKKDCHIVAVPSKRNKTLYDYNVNLLRTTTECMSAILGGADTVANLAYDAIYHKDNEFGERIARNQLLILKGESYLDKVANPADGSYYIEQITKQLAEDALRLFKHIESNGGFLRQLKEHTLQKKIKESALKEQDRFDTGRKILVGSNKYSNDQDRMKGELELYPFVKTQARKTLLEPIIERRLTESLEQKRLGDE